MNDKSSIVIRICFYVAVAFFLSLLCYSYLYVKPADNRVGRQFDNIARQQRATVSNLGYAERGIDSAEVNIRTAIKDADSITIGLGSIKSELATGKDIIADSQRRIERCLEIVGEAREKSTAY